MKQLRKNGKYSHTPINLFTWRIFVLVATILFCLFASHYGNIDNTYVAEKVEQDAFMKPVVVEESTYEGYMEKVDECNKSGGHVLTSSHSDNSICTTPSIEIGKKVEPSIEDLIRKYFPRSHKTIVAIAKAESGMTMDAVGYNCYYYRGVATTTKIVGGSRACDVPDRHLAWSRDCGILQINTTAKVCPKETVDEHLKRAADLSRVQGLGAWVTYNTGAHEQYMVALEKHLAKN